jgi:transposase
MVDQRFESLYLFAACRPSPDRTFALALPRVNVDAMTICLEHFAQQLEPDVHAVLMLDQAGWHDARALHVPDTITLLPLPPASPALNPVERVWLYLRERYLSHRMLDDDEAVLDAVCRAWNRLLNETGRLTSLTAYPYLTASGIP